MAGLRILYLQDECYAMQDHMAVYTSGRNELRIEINCGSVAPAPAGFDITREQAQTLRDTLTGWLGDDVMGACACCEVPLMIGRISTATGVHSKKQCLTTKRKEP